MVGQKDDSDGERGHVVPDGNSELTAGATFAMPDAEAFVSCAWLRRDELTGDDHVFRLGIVHRNAIMPVRVDGVTGAARR
jgi:hypothetical protein